MKKKRPLLLSLVYLLLLTLIGACGSNKHLDPQSDLILQGADPPAGNVDVNPPFTQNASFVFLVQLSDANLSMVDSDAWIIDRYSTTFSLVSDPGGHLLALPADGSDRPKTRVKPYSPIRLPVEAASDVYLSQNAQGFIGTADTARVKMRAVFHVHRVKDGARKTLAASYYMTVGDF